MPLNRLKQNFPLNTVDFSVAREIDDEPSFKEWVPCTLRRQDLTIAGVNKRASRVTHKHDIELPTSVSHSKSLDDMSENTL